MRCLELSSNLLQSTSWTYAGVEGRTSTTFRSSRRRLGVCSQASMKRGLLEEEAPSRPVGLPSSSPLAPRAQTRHTPRVTS